MKEDYPYPTLKNNPLFYNDQRPLTDETLKELGFKKPVKEINKWWYSTSAFDIVLDKNGKDWDAYIYGIHKHKKAGSVRMLIETLKGDE